MAHTLLDRPRDPGARDAGPRGIGTDERDRCARPSGAELERRRRYDHARAILEDARGVIEHGWLQHGWYVVDRPRTAGSWLARLREAHRTPEIDEVRQACLVAAVALAARGGGRPAVLADAGPALDLTWDALQESRGDVGRPVSGRPAAPAVRAARMRDLVEWNDAAGRTRGEVIALLDRAISRSIMGAVGSPGR